MKNVGHNVWDNHERGAWKWFFNSNIKHQYHTLTEPHLGLEIIPMLRLKSFMRDTMKEYADLTTDQK